MIRALEFSVCFLHSMSPNFSLVLCGRQQVAGGRMRNADILLLSSFWKKTFSWKLGDMERESSALGCCRLERNLYLTDLEGAGGAWEKKE